jgi:hypothetical protein
VERSIDFTMADFTIAVSVTTTDGSLLYTGSLFVHNATAGCGHWEQRPVLDENGEETGSYEWVWVPQSCDPPPCTPGHWEQRPVLDENGEETGSYEWFWVPEDPPGCT